jgi:ribose 5-phosphate isomerase B
MSKKLISEQTILDAVKKSERVVFSEQGAIVTDAAKDRAKQLNVRIEISNETKPPQTLLSSKQIVPIGTNETIAIGSDHGGFALKEVLKPFLQSLGFNVLDLGANSEESCDYPDFAYAVASIISTGGASRGIMIDSVGLASAIVANKIEGIRAACCFDEYSARSSREHNNANVLTLGGKTLGAESAKSITKVWLETPFSGGRHQKRLDKISDIEKKRAK